jgi:hypothetical protein
MKKNVVQGSWLTVVMSMMFDEECLSATTILPRLLMSTRNWSNCVHSSQHRQ